MSLSKKSDRVHFQFDERSRVDISDVLPGDYLLVKSHRLDIVIPNIQDAPMNAPTVKIHPLAEVIAKKLFGIETVNRQEQNRMVQRAVKAAVEWHKAREKEIIEVFVSRVNSRAERTISETKMVSGAHYNAMLVELAEMKKFNSEG